MPALVRIVFIAALSTFLAGCGTNVRRMLEEETRLSWHVASVIEDVEALNKGLENPIYDAEAAKSEACKDINFATAEQFYGPDLTYWERIWSELQLLFVRIYPMPAVERCAEAHNRYKGEISNLRRRLEVMGVDVKWYE